MGANYFLSEAVLGEVALETCLESKRCSRIFLYREITDLTVWIVWGALESGYVVKSVSEMFRKRENSSSTRFVI